ncbi:MAG: transposase [Negativicutes bacterium]|nr:transposase [Negativicutes bacterium]
MKLLPKDLDRDTIHKTFVAIRNALNYVSNEVYLTKNMNYMNLNLLLYRDVRTKFGLKAQMAQSIQKTVIAKYKSLQSNGHDWTKVIFKQPEYDLVYGRDYSFKNGKLSINTLDGRIQCDFLTDIGELPAGKYGTAKLFSKRGKFRFHVPITTQFGEPDQVVKVVGVDMGINYLATSFDGTKTFFYDGRQVKVKRGQYSRVRKELQQVGTPSSRRRLKAIGQRERRFMTDVNHVVSKTLVAQAGENSLIAIEDLTGVRNATEQVRVKNRYVSVSWAFYQLRQMIEYKAVRNNSVVAACDSRYTSQTCPKCGHVCRSNRNKKTHVFCCKLCGYQSNDDRIGAMNLRLKGIKYLGKGLVGVNLPPTGVQSITPDATTRPWW